MRRGPPRLDRQREGLTIGPFARGSRKPSLWAAAVLALWPIAADRAAHAATARVVSQNDTVRTSAGSAPIDTREVHDIPSRGERTRLLVETAAAPVAVAILFAGGKGAVRLTGDGRIGWGNGNFVIRSRVHLLRNGITTAIFDAPTDQPYDLRLGFRGSADHATDIGAAIAHLRARYGKPVWLIGTSRGTNSVANAAIRLGDRGADGIVLTASVLAWNEKGDNLLDFALEKIVVPVLVAHHEADECWATSPSDVPELVSRLTAAEQVETRLYGGGVAQGNECHPFHYHGFHGIEGQVAGDIAAWIKRLTR